MENTPEKPTTRRHIYFQHTPTFERLFCSLFSWRTLRRALMVIICLMTLAAIFYTEELWRGKRAWEKIKGEIEAKGQRMDWSAHIPPPVPDDQNIFKAPHMQQWFAGRWGDQKVENRADFATKDFDDPGKAKSDPYHVLEILVVQPGGAKVAGPSDKVVRLNDPAGPAMAEQLVRETVGPILGQVMLNFSVKQPELKAPRRLWLETDRDPGANELTALFPNLPVKYTAAQTGWAANGEVFHLAPDGDGGHKFILLLDNVHQAGDYLAWSDQFQSEFNDIREALKRPEARIECNYEKPFEITIVNFVVIRNLAQRLAQRAQCYLLLGQPEKALAELTLIHDIRHLLKGKPITLVAAMINVAVTGLYVSTIADGLRLHALHEPQLAALQEQLREINLPSPVLEAFRMERLADSHYLESFKAGEIKKFFRADVVGKSPKGKVKIWDYHQLYALWPRGWTYQNMAVATRMLTTLLEGTDSVDGSIRPGNVKTAQEKMEDFAIGESPYHLMAGIMVPNFIRAIQTTAQNQSLVQQAFIACALERAYLAHGDYPETLAALVPQYADKIPSDIIMGGPFHYRRAADGTFILYSVGWNETDDGGKQFLTNAGQPDLSQGDLVWQAMRR